MCLIINSLTAAVSGRHAADLNLQFQMLFLRSFSCALFIRLTVPKVSST